MVFRILADITILFHIVWILFIVFGIIFAFRKSRIAFLHIAGLLFSLLLNLAGWYCPLTYLENYLRVIGESNNDYSGSFIANYLSYLIYPDLPEFYIRIGGILFVVINLVGYAYILKKSIGKNSQCRGRFPIGPIRRTGPTEEH